MKPINGIRYAENREPLQVKSEKITQYESDQKVEQTIILDTIRNTYISDNSSILFCNDLLSEPLNKISAERQAVVEDLVHKFTCLSIEERLLFFLRMPVNNSQTPYDPKLNILAGRVEIRRTAAWIRSHLQVDCDSSIPKRDVYDKYMEYCQSSRMIPISIADFGKVMKHMYPSVRPRRLGTRGKSQYCYAGMTSCQDLKRPDLYDENSYSFANDGETSSMYDIQYAGQNVKPHQYLQDNFESKLIPSGNSFMIFDNRNNMYDAQIDSKANQFEISDNCSDYVKRCKQRKSLICTRNKYKKSSFFNSKSPKDFPSIDSNSDCQVEEEMAQYFQSENPSMKLVRENTPSANAFHRSLSYTGGTNVQHLHQNRSQSSAAVCAPKWANDENYSENRHSASCVTENVQFRSDSREATEKFRQLKLRSQSSQNSHHSLENTNEQCGFTPISPSPIPWSINSTPAKDSHLFLKPDSINFPSESLIRPRSYSTETKFSLKRDFRHAFSKITMSCNSKLENPSSSAAEAFRSQSLPCFDQNGPDEQLNQADLIEESSEIINNSESTTMACDELGRIFNNSMETDICYENGKFDENLMPSQDGLISQLDGILDEIKPSSDVEVNSRNCKIDIESEFGILPQNSLENVNNSHEMFKTNFDQFF